MILRRIKNAAHLVVSCMGAYYQGFVEHKRPEQTVHVALFIMGAAQPGPIGWWYEGRLAVAMPSQQEEGS
jgi:hypothetical protein